MRRVALAVSAWVAGCDLHFGDQEPPISRDAVVLEPVSPLDLDFDVATHASGWVNIWWLPDARPDCAAMEYYPEIGECLTFSDVAPCDDPVPCLTRVAVERDGVVLGEPEYLNAWYPTLQINVPTLFDAPGARLVVEACGSSTSIPLPSSPPAPPVVTDLSTDGDRWVVGWSASSQPSGVFGTFSIGVGAYGCQRAVSATTDIPIMWNSRAPNLHLATVVDRGTAVTPWGRAREWNTTDGDWFAAVAPIPPDAPGGPWMYPIAYVPNSPSVTVGGFTSNAVAWGFRQVADGSWRHELRTEYEWVRYTAGETTDSMRVGDSDGYYVGTFPHVAPTNELDFGPTGDRIFALTIGPVTLIREDDPSLTRSFTLEVHAEHRMVARPVD